MASTLATPHKGNARKVRRLANDRCWPGFPAHADAFTLFERFEGKREKYGT